MNQIAHYVSVNKNLSLQIILIAWMIWVAPSNVCSQHRLIEKFDIDDNNIVEIKPNLKSCRNFSALALAV